MQIQRGLIMVDLTKVAPEAPPADPVELGAIPEDLAERTVSRRQRYQTTYNWKQLRQFLWSEPGLAFGNGCDEIVELGPLSYVALRDGDAALVRLIPKYPGQSEIELVEMPRQGASADGAADPIGDALRERGDAIAAAPLERGFYDWYWSKMAPPATAG
jgi:hypothetical protein